MESKYSLTVTRTCLHVVYLSLITSITNLQALSYSSEDNLKIFCWVKDFLLRHCCCLRLPLHQLQNLNHLINHGSPVIIIPKPGSIKCRSSVNQVSVYCQLSINQGSCCKNTISHDTIQILIQVPQYKLVSPFLAPFV